MQTRGAKNQNCKSESKYQYEYLFIGTKQDRETKRQQDFIISKAKQNRDKTAEK